MARAALVASLLATAVAAGVAGPASPVAAGGPPTFVVTTASDGSTGGCDPASCTLREAIEASNAQPEGTASTIAFAVPGPVPVTIAPVGLLPDLTRSVTVDGTTQPGYAGTPVVEVDLTSSGRILVFAPGEVVVIRGLAVNRSPGDGIELRAGYGIVERNVVGTGPGGDVARGNRGSGVFVNRPFDPPAALVQDNVLSGNATAGVLVDGGVSSTSVTVRRNLVGTDRTGTAAIPNHRAGVRWLSAYGALVDNVVSGNTGTGIVIAHDFLAATPFVAGNLVGTDVTGRAPLGNGGDGVRAVAEYVRVGGPDDPNVVAANGGHGIVVESARGFTIENNRVGTDLTGKVRMGNGRAGIAVREGTDPLPTSGIVGSDVPTAGNHVAFNGGPGILVADPTSEVTIRRNAIHGNGGLAVDLGGDGVTPNDAGDADGGPNGGQNHPVLQSVTAGDGTAVTGTLDALPSTAYVVDVVADAACDPSGHGEARWSVGSFRVVTDAVGHAGFERTLARTARPGAVAAATATRLDGEDERATSELSACVAVVPA